MQGEVFLKVDGMTCNNCAAGITKSLRDIGFKDADASFIDGEVSFTTVEGKSADLAVEKIESLGYSVLSEKLEVTGWKNPLERKFIISLVFTLPLFMHMFLPESSFLNKPLVQIALCLPVYIIGVMHFGKSALGSLKAGLANMDVLIFMGSSSAFFYSLIGTGLTWGTNEVHNYLFFETTATIITLVLLGNVLEHRAVSQTAKSLGELSKMKAEIARIVMQVGSRSSLFETDPSAVKKGDILQVNEGEFVPVDGLLQSGSPLLNESSITGEAVQIEKKVGDPLYSGTLVSSGNFRMEATAEAKNSTLEKIINLVKKARKDQPQIQKLGDRVSGIFVPVVLVIGLMTFLLGHFLFDLSVAQALMNAVAVLVISCPCAMGLATPTAVVAGVGRAAKMGIIIKGGSTLEAFAKSQTIIFDKTGTLTTGDFSAEIAHNEIGERAKSLIKALEDHSSHPIANSIKLQFRDVIPEKLTEVNEVKGKGMIGTTETGERVLFGKNTHSSYDFDLCLEINEKVVAGLNVSDEIRDGAAELITYFKNKGIRTVLLSGDKEEKVKRVADVLGIDEHFSNYSPEEKLGFIEARGEKENVTMVGDGINDGPALSRANVGISLMGSSALALNSARIVIMNPSVMEGLILSFKASNHTYLTIKQNLFWAFFYNVVAIPVAAVGLLNPMVAALAMAFSDVIVIGNSIRLRYKNLD
jgi:Cu+-exporting ATPase